MSKFDEMKDEPEMSLISYKGVIMQMSARKEYPYTIIFKAGDEFKDGITNPLKTANGETVGEMHRRNAHEFLDRWVDYWIEKGEING